MNQETKGSTLMTNTQSRFPKNLALWGGIIGLVIGCVMYRNSILSASVNLISFVVIFGLTLIGSLIGLLIYKRSCQINIPNSSQTKSARVSTAAILWGCAGAFIGAILGVPGSYFIQSGAFRAWVSVVQYVSKFSEIIQNDELQATAITGILLFAIIGGVLGVVIANKKSSTHSS